MVAPVCEANAWMGRLCELQGKLLDAKITFPSFVTVVVGFWVGLFLALILDTLRNLPPRGTHSIWPYFPVGLSVELHKQRRRFLFWLVEQTNLAGGKTWTFRLAFMPRIYILTTAENVQHILKDKFDNYGKGPRFMHRLRDLFGRGIFNVEGAEWFHQRKTASHLFRQSTFKNGMMTAINRVSEPFLSALEKRREGDKPVNITDIYFALTFDVISEVAFGADLGTLRNGAGGFALDFDLTQKYISDLVLKPPGFEFIAKHFTEPGKEYKRALVRLNKHIKQVVAQNRAKAEKAETLEEASDLLSMFMIRKDPTTDKPYTDEFLRDVVTNFMLAGRDSTAAGVLWLTWMLANHPECQEKAFEEIQRIRKGKSASEPLVFEELQQMRYIEACFTETLRMYPSVPKNAKVAFKDDYLPDGTFVKAGSFVVYSPFLMGRLEQGWSEPEKFIPERHMHDDVKPSPFAMPTFQPGPRVCLGERFTYTEAKAVMVKLLTAYKVKPAPDQDLTLLHVNFILRPIADTYVLLEPRVPEGAIAAGGAPSTSAGL